MKKITYLLSILPILLIPRISAAQWATPGTTTHSTSNPEIQRTNPKLILDNSSNGTAGIQFNNGATIDATFGYNESTDYFTMTGSNLNGLSVDGNLFVDNELAISQLSNTVLQFGEPSTGLLNYFPAKIAIGSQVYSGDLNVDGGADTEIFMNSTAESRITFDQGANTGYLRMIGDLWEFRNTSNDGEFIFTKNASQTSTAEPAILTIKNTGKIGVAQDNPNGQMDIYYNSSGASGTLELVETEDNDFTRIFFRNSQDLSKRWSLSGNLGSTDDHTFGLFYDGQQRMEYNEVSSVFEFDGIIDLASGFNTALRIDGKEAIWWEPVSERISWGFGGEYNYFADEVRIGGSGSGAPGYQLEVVGSADISGELTAASDRRLKKNIKDIDNALTLINRLRPKIYNFRVDEFPDMHLAEGDKMGFLAQDLETVLPELVSTGGEVTSSDAVSFNSKSVNYIELIPLLTKAIQEQQNIIDQQQQLLSKYRDGLSQLSLRVSTLESQDQEVSGEIEVTEEN